MTARAQTTYYPNQAQAAGFNPNMSPMCKICNGGDIHYAGLTCCTDDKAQNTEGDQTEKACQSYCNVTCNNVCETRQAYCSIGHENITSHANINSHPAIACVASGQIIAKSWTAAYWNALFNELDTAEGLGHLYHTPSSASAQVAANQSITAAVFNTMANKYRNLRAGASSVAQGQVITGALAAQFKNLYGSLKFFAGACDICNVGKQGKGVCTCACSCPCSCECGCDDPEPTCDCECDCDTPNP